MFLADGIYFISQYNASYFSIIFISYRSKEMSPNQIFPCFGEYVNLLMVKFSADQSCRKFRYDCTGFSQDLVYLQRMKNHPSLLTALAITVDRLRKERRLTKTALADFAELQECYIRGITKGRKNPSITVIYAICGALGIEAAEFFKAVDEELKNLNERKS